jgi:hypothetical protein
LKRWPTEVDQRRVFAIARRLVAFADAAAIRLDAPPLTSSFVDLAAEPAKLSPRTGRTPGCGFARV